MLSPLQPTRLALPSSPQIGVAVSELVDKERKWHHASNHPLRKGNPGVHMFDKNDIIRKSLNDYDKDCFYFFGHTGSSEGRFPWIEFKQYKIFFDAQLGDDGKPKLRFQNDPVVVFLNGCSTAPVLNYLIQNGDFKVCGVGTVGPIPAPFAAEYARLFWLEFLGEKAPLGTALLEASRTMAREYKNPLGLLYTLFGIADTRIQGDP